MWNRAVLVLTLFVFFLIANSCKKDEPITIDVAGKVTDVNSGSAISGVSVKIQSQGVSGGTYSSNWSTIDQTTTNSSGTYNFSFERKNVNKYRIFAEKSGYFSTEEIVNSDEMDLENTNTFNLQMGSVSWFKISIRNTNPFDSTDYFYYQNQSALLSCGSGCCDASVQELFGDNVDTSYKCQTQGGQYIRFEASWVKNGFPQTLTDSVFLPVNDTAFYQLDY